MPILALAYLFNYLDRTSVGFAALQMNQASVSLATQFGWGAGIMFFSYCLLEVPSNMPMYRFGARRWIARIMITWGLAAAATAFASVPISFYVIRFLLGVFEAGFFPGVIYFISIWFPARYRTRVLALFMAATPLSSLIGGPVSASLLRWTASSAWPAGSGCSCSRACPPASSASPACGARRHAEGGALADAAEREALVTALDAEKHEQAEEGSAGRAPRRRASHPHRHHVRLHHRLLRHRHLAAADPEGHGLCNMRVGLVSAIPYFFATIGMLVWARFVDRSGQKSSISIAAWSCGAVGLIALDRFASLIPALVGLTLALVGTISARTVFYTIPQSFLTGAAAAGGLAFINSVGASGGFVGPFMVGWLKDATGSYNAGMLGMAAILVVATGIAGALKLVIQRI